MPRVILTFIYFSGNIDIWLPEYTLVASTHTSIAYTMKGRGLGELDNVEPSSIVAFEARPDPTSPT